MLYPFLLGAAIAFLTLSPVWRSESDILLINVTQIQLPPLRERKEDIPNLVSFGVDNNCLAKCSLVDNDVSINETRKIEMI